MIEWNVIGIIALVALACGIHVPILKFCLDMDFDEMAGLQVVILAIVIPTAIIGEFLIGIMVWAASIALYHWGIGNVLLSVLVSALGIGIPTFGRKLLFKIPIALYHFTRKQITDFQQDAEQYKAKLEKDYPIKQIEPYIWK